jgi:hypothetical protein
MSDRTDSSPRTLILLREFPANGGWWKMTDGRMFYTADVNHDLNGAELNLSAKVTSSLCRLSPHTG